MSKFGGLGGLGNLAKMMKNVGGLQKQMEEQQRELEKIEVTGESGAGACSVRMTAKHNLIAIDLSDECWNDGKDVVLDLVIAAHNDAMQKADAVVKEKMSDFTSMFGDME